MDALLILVESNIILNFALYNLHTQKFISRLLHPKSRKESKNMRHMINFSLVIAIGMTATLLSAQTSQDSYEGTSSDTANMSNRADNGEDGPQRQRSFDQPTQNTWAISPMADVEAQASFVEDSLLQIQRICEYMGDEYKVACFAVTYKDLANALQSVGGDDIIRSSLNTAARKLDQLVRSNLDQEKAALQAHLTNSTGEKLITTRAMRATVTAKNAVLKNQAAKILEEAETVLLRSASSTSPTRALSYQKVAAAIGSNKILLRSA